MTLQYKEIKEKILNKTNDKKEKEKDKDKNKDKESTHKYRSTSGKKLKKREKSQIIGKVAEQPRDTAIGAANTFSQRQFGAAKKNPILRKHRSNSKPVPSTMSSQTMKPKTQIFNNNNKLKEAQKAILNDELNDIKKLNKNESFIDEDLNKFVKQENPQLTNFMNEFNKKIK